MWVYENWLLNWLHCKGAPAKILPRARNYSGPALFTISPQLSAVLRLCHSVPSWLFPYVFWCSWVIDPRHEPLFLRLLGVTVALWSGTFEFIFPEMLVLITYICALNYSLAWVAWLLSVVTPLIRLPTRLPWWQPAGDPAPTVSSSKTLFLINSAYTNNALNARVHV